MKSFQIPLMIVSIVVLFVVLWNIIKNHMNIGYAMVWILWSLGMIVISIFPEIVIWIGEILGIEVASNTIFLITIFLLYCLTFYLFLKISIHNEEIVKLNYEVSSLKKKISDIENRNDE